MLMHVRDTSRMGSQKVYAATTDVEVASRWKAACERQYDRRSSGERPDSWGIYFVKEKEEYSMGDFEKHPIHLTGPAWFYPRNSFTA